MTGYFVVFEYTQKAGGYCGVRTYTSYSSKEEFDRERLKMPNLLSGEMIVLDEGVSEKRREELIRKTPLASYVGAALEEATMPDGSLDPDLLELHLINAKVVIANRT